MVELFRRKQLKINPQDLQYLQNYKVQLNNHNHSKEL